MFSLIRVVVRSAYSSLLWFGQITISAVEFLLAHKFRMEAPFLQGVNYLSREEEALARRIELSKRDKEDIQIRSSDVDSLEFVKRVRHEIETWKSRTTVRVPLFINSDRANELICRHIPISLTFLPQDLSFQPTQNEVLTTFRSD